MSRTRHERTGYGYERGSRRNYYSDVDRDMERYEIGRAEKKRRDAAATRRAMALQEVPDILESEEAYIQRIAEYESAVDDAMDAEMQLRSGDHWIVTDAPTKRAYRGGPTIQSRPRIGRDRPVPIWKRESRKELAGEGIHTYWELHGAAPLGSADKRTLFQRVSNLETAIDWQESEGDVWYEIRALQRRLWAFHGHYEHNARRDKWATPQSYLQQLHAVYKRLRSGVAL